MSYISKLLYEATGAGPEADGAGSTDPDSPGQLYKAGLNQEQLDKKSHADYRAYRNSAEVAGVTPIDHESWLGKQKPWDSEQKTMNENYDQISDELKQIDEQIAALNDIRKALVEKLNHSTDTMESIDANGRDHAMEMVKRLRELSGLSPLANSTTVAGKPVSDLYK